MAKGRKSNQMRTIKVYDETYAELVKILSTFQLQLCERVSFDYVIRRLIDYAPQTEVIIHEGVDIDIDET